MRSSHEPGFFDEIDASSQPGSGEPTSQRALSPIAERTNVDGALEPVPDLGAEKLPLGGCVASNNLLERCGFQVLDELRAGGATFVVADLRLTDLSSLDALAVQLSAYTADAVTVDSLCGPEAINTIVERLGSVTKVFVIPYCQR